MQTYIIAILLSILNNSQLLEWIGFAFILIELLFISTPFVFRLGATFSSLWTDSVGRKFNHKLEKSCFQTKLRSLKTILKTCMEKNNVPV